MRRLFAHFRVVYYLEPKLPSLTQNIVTAPTHPLYPKFKERLSQRRRNPFWYLVTGNLLNEKRIIRSKACRKLRLAFQEALAEFGYDEDGNSLKLEDKSPLRGSLEIHPMNKEIVEAKPKELKGDLVLVVGAIRQEMENTSPPLSMKILKR